jgi:dCTP deaminase
MHKKRCIRCRELKPTTDFYKEGCRKDGLRPNCKACCRKDNQRRYKANKGAYRQKHKDYVDQNRERVNAKNTEWRKRIRRAALEHYGGQPPKCAICGERQLGFLTIDHVDGGGNHHRRRITRGGYSIYVWLRQQGYPKGFRVLCFNCNYGEYRGGLVSSLGGILSGPEILNYMKEGHIQIEPFNESHLNPASVDLTLGKGVTQYLIDGILDVRVEAKFKTTQIGPEGFVLQAHQGYLMHTEEVIWSDSTVPVLDGKSSLGRLFLSVHETAGYIDPGFRGQVTLEVAPLHSVRVYAGMRICQVRFHPIVGEVALYNGHYVGNSAKGAVPSMVHHQMQEQDG